MKFKYDNQGTNTYLTYEIEENASIDSMSMGMITNNKIAGLAPAIFTQMDMQKFIKYNITSTVSLKQFFGDVINKKRLIGAFKGIVNALLSAEEYMIDINTVLLDLDYIYVDVSTYEVKLICVPVTCDSINVNNFSMFFKNIMFSYQFDLSGNDNYVARIMNFINSSAAFSLVEFKKVLEDIDTVGQAAERPSAQVVQKPQPTNNPSQQQGVYTPPVYTPPREQQIQSQPVMPQNIMQSGEDKEEKKGLFSFLSFGKKETAAPAKEKEEKKKKDKKEKDSSKGKKNAPAQNANMFGFAIPGAETPDIEVKNNAPQAWEADVQAKPAPAPTPAPAQNPYVVQKQNAYAGGGMKANFGDTVMVGSGKKTDTLIIGAQQQQIVKPRLVRLKTNEEIAINKSTMHIGREASYADYVIGDNPAISKSHADIVTHGGEYFVVDTNSSNHTFVNENMISSNVEVKLAHGDKVRFATEMFEFRLY